MRVYEMRLRFRCFVRLHFPKHFARNLVCERVKGAVDGVRCGARARGPRWLSQRSGTDEACMGRAEEGELPRALASANSAGKPAPVFRFPPEGQ